MNGVRVGGMIFLFALCAFAGLLTQHRGWITAAIVAALVVGHEVGQRRSDVKQPH